ncbi:hypothetical protein [Chryseobacterium sp.]|uniref:hypothetical protein n=1 Tax=Chryseobacterium sp. TaxID=1871047 RepID=UPI002899EBC8|nr:hypothetical protein [Chryseobacterium sp.]
MRTKLSRRLSILLFIISFSLCFGQKTEFIIPKNIETLQNSVFNFTNEFTKDEPKAAAAGGETFSTTVDLYNLKYDTDYQNPYLKLGLKKGAKAKQSVQHAIWNITLEKVSSKNTKVIIFLEKIVPDSGSKKDVDIKQTQSTGKVEAEIKEFLLNDKEAAEALQTIEAASAAATEAADQIAAAEAKNVQKKVPSKKLQSLFSKKQFIPLPVTEDTFTKALQVQPDQKECADCKDGKYASWDFDDFNMIDVNMNHGLNYYALQYYGDQMVSGLPYGLVFNGSSPSECKTKFAKYNAQLYQTSVEVDENTSKALTVVAFKMNTSHVRLEFGNEYLTRLVISNKEF